MLPKAPLTWHSRMSGSRWVTTPSWLSQSLRAFLVALLCSLPASSSFLLLLLGPVCFCPLVCSSLCEVFRWYLHVHQKISSLAQSVIFLYFFSFFIEEGLLISPCYFWELCIQLGMSFPFSLAFCFSSFLSCAKTPQTATLPSCISSSLGWFWSLPPV